MGEGTFRSRMENRSVAGECVTSGSIGVSPGFVIDECLSPSLVQVAAELGIYAQHIVHIGMGADHDYEVVRLCGRARYDLRHQQP